MNKIFYRYIARSFWAPFGFGLGVFCLLLIFGSLFDKLNFFMKSGAGGGLFARYILYQAPYFIVKMTPMATLLAVLFSLGNMMSKGEWKAGLAGGWRPFDMLKPLLACAFLAGAGAFVFALAFLVCPPRRPAPIQMPNTRASGVLRVPPERLDVSVIWENDLGQKPKIEIVKPPFEGAALAGTMTGPAGSTAAITTKEGSQILVTDKDRRITGIAPGTVTPVSGDPLTVSRGTPR